MKVDGKSLNVLSRVSGSDSLIETDSGVWVATVTFNCAWDKVFSLMPRRDVSKHPDFNFLKCVGSKVSRSKGGIAIVEATYQGAQNSVTGAGGGSGANSPIIEVSSTTTEEPIETNEKFEEMAGTPEAPLWPGVFDDDGKFAGFPVKNESGTKCPYAGVTSYLAPRTVVTRTTQSRNEPASTRVGFREKPPTGGAKDYLKTEHSYTKNGGVYTITESWLGPAEGGEWDTKIYPS